MPTINEMSDVEIEDLLSALTRSTRWPWTSLRSEMLAVASKMRKPRRPSMVTTAKSLWLVESRPAVSIASS